MTSIFRSIILINDGSMQFAWFEFIWSILMMFFCHYWIKLCLSNIVMHIHRELSHKWNPKQVVGHLVLKG